MDNEMGRQMAGYNIKNKAEISGYWTRGEMPPGTGPDAIRNALFRPGLGFYLVDYNGTPAVAVNGRAMFGNEAPPEGAFPIIASVPPVTPECLGDPSFLSAHGAKLPCMAGSMAHGISSAELVETLSKEGIPAFLGTAGMDPQSVTDLIERLKDSSKDGPWGINLIHTPSEPALEDRMADIFIESRISLIEASAFMGLTRALVRYRLQGLRQNPDGSVTAPNRIIAKVSRAEVATAFMSPAPDQLLSELIDQKKITKEEARLAALIPVAEDVTVEADSGGHTDNRPAIALFPGICALRDQLSAKFKYAEPPRLGLGGGISTPASAAAAFSMGAAYLVTGSVNQACIEAGTSKAVKKLLSETQQADVVMAPAADMFEMGVRVQVLKRGTMFAMRAKKLFDLYSRYDSYDSIPQPERSALEKGFFRTSFDEIWQGTARYFEKRDPSQIQRAGKDQKHKMALVFRWYLSQSSHWAISGDESRRMDYQIWCGPSMGAFNEWTKGSFLELPENRRVVNVTRNILFGAAVIERYNILRRQSILPRGSYSPIPLQDRDLNNFMS